LRPSTAPIGLSEGLGGKFGTVVDSEGGRAAVDRHERRVLLFATEWERQYFERQHPEIALLAESPVAGPPAGRR
jgi:hypothetical protein